MLCFLSNPSTLSLFKSTCQRGVRFLSTVRQYVQGQNDPEKPKIREYFYYIDHNGMLFLDDSRMKNFTSCFKEKVFLNFFFKNLKFNRSGRYESDFPFVSMCGIERNFVRCDDVPIVFTNITPDNELLIAYSDLKYPFKPESLYMIPENDNLEREDCDSDDSSTLIHSGRIYHEASTNLLGYGLIRSTLAQEIGHLFVFDDARQPIKFKWNDQLYTLNNQLGSRIHK